MSWHKFGFFEYTLAQNLIFGYKIFGYKSYKFDYFFIFISFTFTPYER